MNSPLKGLKEIPVRWLKFRFFHLSLGLALVMGASALVCSRRRGSLVSASPERQDCSPRE